MLFSKNFLIGQELVRREYISQEQLDEGLILHQRKNIRLGKALIELGYLSEKDLIKVIADQIGIEAVSLEGIDISKEVLEKVPKKYIKSLNIIPIAYNSEKETITICVVDPLEKKLQQKLEHITGLNVKMAIALEDEIADAIEKYYDFE